MLLDTDTTIYSSINHHLHKLVESEYGLMCFNHSTNVENYIDGTSYIKLQNDGYVLRDFNREFDSNNEPAVVLREVIRENRSVPNQAMASHIQAIYVHEEFYVLAAWYKHGRLHREKGPAFTDNNMEAFFIDGKCHRLDGPAFRRGNYLSWVVNDVNISKDIDRWSKENGIDLDNLTLEDKTLIKMKWG